MLSARSEATRPGTIRATAERGFSLEQLEQTPFRQQFYLIVGGRHRREIDCWKILLEREQQPLGQIRTKSGKSS